MHFSLATLKATRWISALMQDTSHISNWSLALPHNQWILGHWHVANMCNFSDRISACSNVTYIFFTSFKITTTKCHTDKSHKSVRHLLFNSGYSKHIQETYTCRHKYHISEWQKVILFPSFKAETVFNKQSWIELIMITYLCNVMLSFMDQWLAFFWWNFVIHTHCKHTLWWFLQASTTYVLTKNKKTPANPTFPHLK